MPPKKHPLHPTPEELRGSLVAIEKELSRAAKALVADAADSGGAFRRLNRVQYENTLNRLFGTHADLASMLPRDAKGAHGFDRVGAALSISGEQIQSYMAVAEYALLNALPRPEDMQRPTLKTTAGTPMTNGTGPKSKLEPRKDLRLLPEGGLAAFKQSVEYPNLKSSTAARYRYKLRIAHAAYQSSGQPVYSRVYSGETTLAFLESKPGEPAVQEIECYLSGGSIGIHPLLDIPYKQPFRSDWTSYAGPGVWLKSVELEGPFVDEWPPRGRTLLFGDLALKTKNGSGRSFAEKAPPGRDQKSVEAVSSDPAADAARLLGGFLPKAFRRPVDAQETGRFVKIVTDRMAGEQKTSFHDAMLLAYTIALSSPDFLFFKEPKGKLDDYEIASRLSYFLGGSAPDEALFAAASAGRLKLAAGRLEQARRLLDSPHAEAFVEDFVDQWLELSQIDATTPDAKMYPEFDPLLKHSMVQETRLFFAEVLRKDLSISKFIDSDWTYLNSRLAAHYQLAGIEGTGMRRVALPAGSMRGGVLTHASVMKVTANGSVTSPIHRGKWILERILGRPPQPPPPNVEGLDSDVRGTATIREQLAKHRQDASCASCHASLDPHGFALENFDVIGGWRTQYRSMAKTGTKVPKMEYRLGTAVESADVLPDGRSFSSAAEYKRLLLSDTEQIARTLTEKLLVYSLGRPLAFHERKDVDAIVSTLRKNDYGLRTLVLEIVQSELFANSN